MFIPIQRSLDLVLGFLVLLGPLSAKGQAQYGPAGLGLNPYVNPLVGSSITGYGGLSYGSLLGGGYGYGGSGYGGLGYGSLHSSGSDEQGNYGGSGGGLLSSALSGAAYSYGYGASNTQWMMNPYQGYLQGAADITRANAQYWQTVQQARLTRQESIRSSLQSRRAMIEEAEWERAHMPDPEKIRQRLLERELSAARISPPLDEIWSGRAINTLLRHLVAQTGDGVKGPRVPLREDIAQHINVKAGDSAGNVALLRNKAELEWPESLQGGAFKEGREQLNALMHRAYRSVDSGNNPEPATLNDLLAQFRKMRDTLQSNVSDLKPDEYIEARRYLSEVNQTIKGLQDPNVGRQFRDEWRPTKARSVAELVQHMRDKGLVFAPASRSDEAAYTALYHALAAYDAGVGRVVSSIQGNPDDK